MCVVDPLLQIQSHIVKLAMQDGYTIIVTTSLLIKVLYLSDITLTNVCYTDTT